MISLIEGWWVIAMGNIITVNGLINRLIRELKHCRTLNDIKNTCDNVGEKGEIIRLLVTILGVDELSVRWKAAVALSDIGPPAVDDLIRCLMHEKACVRSSAAWVLGAIGDIRALYPLQKSIEDTSPEVRKEVTEALRKLQGGGDITDSLIRENSAVKGPAIRGEPSLF